MLCQPLCYCGLVAQLYFRVFGGDSLFSIVISNKHFREINLKVAIKDIHRDFIIACKHAFKLELSIFVEHKHGYSFIVGAYNPVFANAVFLVYFKFIVGVAF